MALVEKYHVVAAVRPVAQEANDAAVVIREGEVVALNAEGEVVKQAGEAVPYGIAGDTKRTDGSSMPGVASGWQNRVSDYYDETRASAMMTVYHSGGEFATDIFDANVGSANAGELLYANDGVLSLVDGANAGAVALLTQPAGPYMSGVPGVDVPGFNDIALSGENENTYIEFKLLV